MSNQLNSEQGFICIASFVEKLYCILQNKDFEELISWSKEGDYFGVKDIGEFSKHVLPKYFKHNNWQSFVRQLNMHGFTKKSDAFHLNSYSPWNFRHVYFHRDHPENFSKIKRRSNKTNDQDSSAKKLSNSDEAGKPDVESQKTPPVDYYRSLEHKCNILEQTVNHYSERVERLEYQNRQLTDSHKELTKSVVSLMEFIQDSFHEERESIYKKEMRMNKLLNITSTLISYNVPSSDHINHDIDSRTIKARHHKRPFSHYSSILERDCYNNDPDLELVREPTKRKIESFPSKEYRTRDLPYESFSHTSPTSSIENPRNSPRDYIQERQDSRNPSYINSSHGFASPSNVALARGLSNTLEPYSHHSHSTLEIPVNFKKHENHVNHLPKIRVENYNTYQETSSFLKSDELDRH